MTTCHTNGHEDVDKTRWLSLHATSHATEPGMRDQMITATLACLRLYVQHKNTGILCQSVIKGEGAWSLRKPEWRTSTEVLNQKIDRQSKTVTLKVIVAPVVNFCLFVFTFYNCIVPKGFLQWKFGLPSQGKASCDRVVLPYLRCMLVVLVFL